MSKIENPIEIVIHHNFIYRLIQNGHVAGGATGNSDAANKEGGEGTEAAGDIGALADMLDNLDAFVLEPAPQGAVVKCRITRDRKGMDRGELYYMLRLLCQLCPDTVSGGLE